MDLLRGVALAAALFAAACASSPFKNTWKPAEEKAVSLRGRSAAVLCLSDLEALRRNVEEAIAEEIDARGGRGIPGYTRIDAERLAERQQAFSLLREQGVPLALVVRTGGREREAVRLSPGFGGWWGPWGRGRGGWVWGWDVFYDPAFDYPEATVTTEVRLYDLERDRLLWAGVSRARVPADWVAFYRGLVREALLRMEAEGVLY